MSSTFSFPKVGACLTLFFLFFGFFSPVLAQEDGLEQSEAGGGQGIPMTSPIPFGQPIPMSQPTAPLEKMNQSSGGFEPSAGFGMYGNTGPQAYGGGMGSFDYGLKMPKEQLTFSDFGGEDEALSHAIRYKVANAIFEEIDSDVLFGYAEKCLTNNESDIVSDIFDRIGSLDDLGDVCSDYEDAIEDAEESSSFCEELPDLMSGFGPNGMSLECPPNEDSIQSFCMERFDEQIEMEKLNLEKRMSSDCKRRVEMEGQNCSRQYEQEQQWKEMDQYRNEGEYNPPKYDQGNYDQGDGSSDGYYDDGSGDGTYDDGSGDGTYDDGSSGGDSGGDGSGDSITGNVTGYPGFEYPVDQGQPSSGQGDYGMPSPSMNVPFQGPMIGPGGGPKQGFIDWMDYCKEGQFDEEGFSSACLDSYEDDDSFAQAEEQMEKICDVQSRFQKKEFERICDDMEDGLSDCQKRADKMKSWASKQLSRCNEQTTPDKIKEHITSKVEQVCKLERVKDKRKKAFELSEAKELEAIEKLAELGNYLDPSTSDAVIGTGTDTLITAAEVTQQTEEQDNKEKKDFVYGIGKFFGFQKQNESGKAGRFLEQSNEIRKTANLLREASESMQDDRAKEDMEEQADELDSRADELEKKGSEINSSAGGIFGGA